MTEQVFSNLPAGAREFSLDLPDVAFDSLFKHILFDWNPQGHPPNNIYGLPHFDFHFYIQSEDAVRAIRPGPCSELIDCDDFKVAQKPVPARYIHADHIDVGAAVPAMGNHLIDSKSAELAPGGPPFTQTFIFGAYDGHVTFYEPMITLAYLLGGPDECFALKLPRAYEQAGYYPSEYCIRASADDTTISLESFVWREAG